jgi:thiosulfate/3-mercaptopyruvate sulfurtransferase
MSDSDSQQIVSTAWLEAHLSAPDVKVLDASWHMPDTGRDARAEYAAAHIPGAAFFDIDDISDTRSPLPHMAPPPEKFVSRMRKLGVGDGHRVVVYDQAGLLSSARAWWMLRLFGHRDVAVLDGGLPKWLAEGRGTEDMAPVLRERHFTARRNAALVRDVTQVAATTKLGSEQVVDARSAPRFRGEAPEPRPGLRSGHIPGALNLHYAQLLNADGTMKDEDAIKAAFHGAGVDLGKPIVSSCGSGVTACILDLALERIGHRRHAVYDGSWAEWGMFPDLKVELG